MYSKESEFDRIEPKKDNLKQEQLDKNYLEKKYQTETSGEEDSTINLGIKIQLNNKPIDEKKMNFEKQESNDRIDSKKELNRTYSSNQLIQKSSQPNLSNSNSDQVAKEVKIINSMIPDQSRLRRKSSDTITIDQGCFIILGIILINVISLLVFFLLVYFEFKFIILTAGTTKVINRKICKNETLSNRMKSNYLECCKYVYDFSCGDDALNQTRLLCAPFFYEINFSEQF